MPCDQIRLCQVKLEASDRELLKEAIHSLGWSYVEEDDVILARAKGVEVTIYRTRVDVRRNHAHLADDLRRAYSMTMLKKAATTFDITLTQTSEWELEADLGEEFVLQESE